MTAPVASGGAGTRPTAREGAGAFRRRVIGVLVGDCGVGRDRVALAPLSEKGTVRASYLSVDSACVRGAAGYVRLGAL